MLEPGSRFTVLAELHPPEGYVLDLAIATTFSLDLFSLLMAPLSMALFECEDQQDALKDPIAIVEALRRVSDRLVVFCQQGQISVPKNDTPLFRYLEKTVVEVKPGDGNGIFHAKTWLMRFSRKGLPVIYRFLCLSKNLTFDRSWDTVLTLEGELKDRKLAFALNNPLGDFIDALPELAVLDVTEEVKNNVALMASEVRRVAFKLPEGFDGYEFLPLGIPGKRKKLEWGRSSRTLIVSPFLSEEPIARLAGSGVDNVLISREESLDELPEETIKMIEKNCQIYVMDTAAEKPAETGEEETSEISSLTDLSGLHAKLVIFEKGWEAFVLSGSANATKPAWSGENIEFMTRLAGKRSRVGINSFLGIDSQQPSFYSMLRPYKHLEKPKDPSSLKKLEKMLDKARMVITSARIRGNVTRSSGGCFMITLASQVPGLSGTEGVKATCYPVSLRAHSGQDISPLLKGEPLVFTNLSPAGLSSFFVFQVEASFEGERATIAFVLNLPLSGIPADRDKQILRSIISDKDRFIRYLLFLLSEGPEDTQLSRIYSASSVEGVAPGSSNPYFGFQLLEELIRAYSRDREKLDRIASLVADFNQSGESQQVLPEGFNQVWEAFLIARDEEKSNKA